MNEEWARIGWRYDQPVSSQVSGSSREGGSAELIVVGGGLIGLSCAWRAAEAGLDVLVIDAGGTERASVVAAGMIAPVGEASWGEDDLLAVHENDWRAALPRLAGGKLDLLDPPAQPVA